MADNYSGAQTQALAITGITSALDGNLYRCRVTNEVGVAYSEPAELTVEAPSEIEIFHNATQLTDGQVINLGPDTGENFPDIPFTINNNSLLHDADFTGSGITNMSPSGAFGFGSGITPDPVPASDTASGFMNGRNGGEGVFPYSVEFTWTWTSLAGNGSITVTFIGVHTGIL